MSTQNPSMRPFFGNKKNNVQTELRVEMRLQWDRAGPQSSDWCPYKRHRDTGRSRAKTEARDASRGPSGAGGGRKHRPCESAEGAALPTPRLWASGRQSWDSVDVCDGKVPVLVAICYGSPRKPIHKVIYLKK